MFRKYRRNPVDLEVLMAMQEIAEITESMELLDSEIVEEIVKTMEVSKTGVCMVSRILKACDSNLETVMAVNEGSGWRLLFLYKDKHGVIVGRRRTVNGRIRQLVSMIA